MQDIFQIMSEVAGLILQTTKCIIIPLVDPLSPKFKLYRSWLSANIPAWGSFKIASCAEYLGFMVGPKAGSCQWDKVIFSASSQIAQLVSSGAPASIAVFNYNVRIVPKFSYKAQLVSPPPH